MSYAHADNRLATSTDAGVPTADQVGLLASAWARLLGWLPSPAATRWPQGRVRLAPNAWRSIDRPAGLRIDCLMGELLVTQEGDARDQLLVTGQALPISGNGHLIVQATRESELRFAPDLIDHKAI